MDYNEILNYLYNSTPMFQKVGSSAYKEGLDNTLALDFRFGHPHKQYRTIHVAGTNGKGSVSHLIASILQHAGYKTGLYTSPHLVDFRERIRVNGQIISKEFITEYINNHVDFLREMQPSFFEITTAMALLYFAHEKVDIAIIEVGLGGRLDCTNIISPDLSIITNISFDHTALLGNTLTLIAKEKAGIIKPHTPIVIGENNPETQPMFIQKAKEENAPILFAEDENTVVSSKLTPSGNWEFDTLEYPRLIDELGGLAQEKNAATVLCSIRELIKQRYNIPPEAVYKGFASVVETTGLQGRWQTISTNPRIILDTAHNQAGIEYIVRQLKQESFDKLHFVIGMVNDKDIQSVLSLLPLNAQYYFTKASIPRALDENILAGIANGFNLIGNTYSSVKEAINHAKNNAQSNDLIFVGGSTFVVADAISS